MKSVRLNMGIRRQIVDACLEHMGHDEESRVIRKKAFNKKYAAKIYNAIYPPNIRRRMNNMPKGAMCTRTEISLRVKVKTDQRDPRDEKLLITKQFRMTVDFDTSRPVFRCHINGHLPFDFKEKLGVSNEAVFEEYKMCDYRDMYAIRRAKENELLQFLRQFNTTKQLIEAWPEGKQFLPKEVVPTTALVIKPTKINEMLGINVAA